MTREEFLGMCAEGATTIDNLSQAILERVPKYIPRAEQGAAAGGARAMAFHLLIELTKRGVIEEPDNGLEDEVLGIIEESN